MEARAFTQVMFCCHRPQSESFSRAVLTRRGIRTLAALLPFSFKSLYDVKLDKTRSTSLLSQSVCFFYIILESESKNDVCEENNKMDRAGCYFLNGVRFYALTCQGRC
jgi:hypothetical protein